MLLHDTIIEEFVNYFNGKLNMRQLTYAQAISEALVQAMQDDPNIFLFGLGVDDHKGIFATTREAFLKFGPRRVFDVPASEGALTGIAIGAALNKKRPVLVHARNDFMFLALDQMINNAAKWKYVYAGKSSVPLVVRGIIGKGWGQGPTHSQSLQAVLAHFPGLTVVMPGSAYDAKGILLKSLTAEGPVVILEHRALYDVKADVPEEKYTLEFGCGRKLTEGKDITVVATSFLVPEAVEAARILEEKGIFLEVIDPVSIRPFDERIVLDSVGKTGRLIVADADWGFCGFASEVAAIVADKAFGRLKSPVKRITFPECPCPVAKSLEDAFYPSSEHIVKTALELLNKKINSTVQRQELADTFLGPY